MSDDVADGVDALGAGVLVGVGGDRPVLEGIDAGDIEPETGSAR